MQWNNTATSQGVFQDIDFLCNTNSATFTIADKTRAVNNWQGYIVAEVIDAQDDWDFKGEIATAALSGNQQEYTFPTAANSGILKIKRIEVDIDSEGKYTPAERIDINEYRDVNMGNTAEINKYFVASDPKYALFDNSFFVFPVPEDDVTDGIKIWYTENVTQFTATAAKNTAEPPFPRPFHRILSLGPTLDFARKNQMDKLISFCERELYGTTSTRQGRVGGLMSKMRKFFSTRSADKKLDIRTRYYDIDYR